MSVGPRTEADVQRKLTALAAAAEIVDVPVFAALPGPSRRLHSLVGHLPRMASHRQFLSGADAVPWCNATFVEALDRLNFSFLVVAGFWMEHEILTTALHARCDRYHVYVPVDAAPARSPLNAPGRVQTTKRRAEVPICDTLAARLREWGEEDGWKGPLTRFRGKRVASVKKSWRSARARAGIGVEDCNPYSLRHTVAKWLRSQSVPPSEVAALLGHKMPGYTITQMYAGADPSHMKATKTALDKLLRAAAID